METPYRKTTIEVDYDNLEVTNFELNPEAFELQEEIEHLTKTINKLHDDYFTISVEIYDNLKENPKYVIEHPQSLGAEIYNYYESFSWKNYLNELEMYLLPPHSSIKPKKTKIIEAKYNNKEEVQAQIELIKEIIKNETYAQNNHLLKDIF